MPIMTLNNKQLTRIVRKQALKIKQLQEQLKHMLEVIHEKSY